MRVCEHETVEERRTAWTWEQRSFLLSATQLYADSESRRHKTRSVKRAKEAEPIERSSFREASYIAIRRVCLCSLSCGTAADVQR